MSTVNRIPQFSRFTSIRDALARIQRYGPQVTHTRAVRTVFKPGIYPAEGGTFRPQLWLERNMNDFVTERYTVMSPGTGFELEDYLSDIGAMMDSIGPKPSVLFGYSHCAFFVTHYALAHSDRVSALILAEPALFNERNELLRRAEMALEGDHEGSLKAMLNHVQPDVASDPNLANAATRVMMKYINDPRSLGCELMVRANHPISTDQLASLKMPVLLVGGTASHANYTVFRAAAAIPQAYVWWLPGATHGDLLGDAFAPKLSAAVNAFVAATS